MICVGLTIIFTGTVLVYSKNKAESSSISVQHLQPSIAPAGDLLGKWDGPEGTYLNLSQSADKFIIEIQDLDTRHTYEGSAIDNQIEFRRNGQIEKIRKGSGVDTGMKWLNGKQNCLVIKSGEGYCRK